MKILQLFSDFNPTSFFMRDWIMEIPLNVIHSTPHRSQVENIECRINNVMQDLGFCSTVNWYGSTDHDDEEVTFQPFSIPWSPTARSPTERALPTGDEFLKLLKMSNRLPYMHHHGSEAIAIPSCQTIALEEFFDPLTSNYCDQQYHFLQLQDTLIDIFSSRHVGCYQLNYGDQEISYIMGYWAPKTKYHNNAGWLIGLRTTTDTN
jgi:hypothetical protein